MINKKNKFAAYLRPWVAKEIDVGKLRKGDHVFLPTIDHHVYHHALMIDDKPDESGSFKIIHFLDRCAVPSVVLDARCAIAPQRHGALTLVSCLAQRCGRSTRRS